MKLAAAILLVISHWDHACYPVDTPPPETVGEFQIREETIAEADAEIAEEVAQPWGVTIVAAGVAVVFHSESRFDWYIHAGVPHPDPSHHEDHGLARCMGSLHANKLLSHDEWLGLAGTSLEATTRCALRTALALRSSHWVCAHDLPPSEYAMALTLEHYARGHCAEPGTESWKRAARWMRTANRIGELVKGRHS